MQVTLSQSSSYPDMTITLNAKSITILEISGATLQEENADTIILATKTPEDLNVLIAHTEDDQRKRSRLRLLRFGIWQYHVTSENAANVA
jgi:hypothetical protein